VQNKVGNDTNLLWKKMLQHMYTDVAFILLPQCHLLYGHRFIQADFYSNQQVQSYYCSSVGGQVCNGAVLLGVITLVLSIYNSMRTARTVLLVLLDRSALCAQSSQSFFCAGVLVAFYFLFPRLLLGILIYEFAAEARSAFSTVTVLSVVL